MRRSDSPAGHCNESRAGRDEPVLMMLASVRNPSGFATPGTSQMYIRCHGIEINAAACLATSKSDATVKMAFALTFLSILDSSCAVKDALTGAHAPPVVLVP